MAQGFGFGNHGNPGWALALLANTAVDFADYVRRFELFRSVGGMEGRDVEREIIHEWAESEEFTIASSPQGADCQSAAGYQPALQFSGGIGLKLGLV